MARAGQVRGRCRAVGVSGCWRQRQGELAERAARCPLAACRYLAAQPRLHLLHQSVAHGMQPRHRRVEQLAVLQRGPAAAAADHRQKAERERLGRQQGGGGAPPCQPPPPHAANPPTRPLSACPACLIQHGLDPPAACGLVPVMLHKQDEACGQGCGELHSSRVAIACRRHPTGGVQVMMCRNPFVRVLAGQSSQHAQQIAELAQSVHGHCAHSI